MADGPYSSETSSLISRRSKRGDGLLGKAEVFAALGDETRLGIVSRMCRMGPTSIAVLTEGSGVSRQAVTKHLRVLEKVGLAKSRVVGRETSWQLMPAELERAKRSLDRISGQWDVALTRLKRMVERPARKK